MLRMYCVFVCVFVYERVWGAFLRVCSSIEIDALSIGPCEMHFCFLKHAHNSFDHITFWLTWCGICMLRVRMHTQFATQNEQSFWDSTQREKFCRKTGNYSTMWEFRFRAIWIVHFGIIHLVFNICGEILMNFVSNLYLIIIIYFVY